LGALAAAAAGVLVAVGMLMLIMVALAEPAGAAFLGQNGKIAFASNRDGNREIYTMNSNGTGLVRLTNNPKGDHYPDWSPDGKCIVFNSTRDGNHEIYIMYSDGTAADRLTNDPSSDHLPEWQPSSTASATAFGPRGEPCFLPTGGAGAAAGPA
jgi:dipeptidyl aminopeptidase/acylaminoacyl peptidase